MKFTMSLWPPGIRHLPDHSLDPALLNIDVPTPEKPRRVSAPKRPAKPTQPEFTDQQQDAIEVLVSLGERRAEAPRMVLLALQNGVDDDAQAIVTHILRHRK